MQVSTRLSYPDPGLVRSRRSWTGEPVPPVRGEERGSGYRGNLARGPQQQVNERPSGPTADKEVFFARSLSSTLAMLQMNALPDSALPPGQSAPERKASEETSFIDDLFAGVLSSGNPQ